MNKTIFFLLFFSAIFFTTVRTNAQNSFFLGANGGVNLSKITFTDDFDELWQSQSLKFGLLGGVSFGIQMNRFSILSGLNFFQKGSEYETGSFINQVNGLASRFTVVERQNFLQIPLLAQYKFIDKRIGLSLALGPSFNIGLSSEQEVTLSSVGGASEKDNAVPKFGSGINDDYKTLQAGFILMPGVSFTAGEKGKIHINFGWEFAMGNSFNSKAQEVAGGDGISSIFARASGVAFDGKQKNRSTFLQVAYTYHFQFGDKY